MLKIKKPEEQKLQPKNQILRLIFANISIKYIAMISKVNICLKKRQS